MHTSLTPTRLQVRRAVPLACWLALAMGALPTVQAAAPTTAPQVLLAITNSESMDGTTSGAIMAGSGGLSSGASSLFSSNYFSPTNYTIPTGFTPPLNVGASGAAPYTVACGTAQCDNGPSRLNLAKAAVKNVISKYADTINFGLYTYSTSGLGLYNTWVYLMSPTASPGAFTFTNTASASTVDNPCYNYSAASATVKTNCGSIAALYAAGALSGNKYMAISASSDAANINDVLYAGNGFPTVFVTSGTVSPTDPYATYSLSTYNTNLGSFSVSYSSTTPSVGGGGWATTPTNAGYVPYTKQVMYVQRGWGYGASQSATTGSVVVPMGTDPSTSTAFTNALAPETNNTASSEIKASAGQSGIGGLLSGANTYLNSLTQAACQSQYVVLLTDGLPTLDTKGKAWPPLGTVTAAKYNLTATFNADGSLASTNSQAVLDAINAITTLYSSGTKTYVIGLGAGVVSANNPIAAQVLKAMAVAGHTNDFFPATDPTSLTNAFSTIVNQIYNESAVAAPVAPISVASGTSLEYQMTSFAAPMAGHVRAYAVAANGMPSGVESWDAAANMNKTNRATALMAANATGAVTALGNVDAAAFNLTATACVPNVGTIVSYTIDPNFTYNGCSYLAGRQASWFLGSFSTQNTGKYVDHPASGLLSQRYATYSTYARGLKARAPLLMFTSNDGFLYAVNPVDGSLVWGWTSRSLLSKMQGYTTFQTLGATNGGFTVVDAMDGTGAWGSYLVGSFQSGAEHFSVKLDSTATPQKVVYDSVVSGATSPGDAYGNTGTVPMHQAPLVAYVGNSAFAVYVVNAGTTSTLYEVNVATGASSSSVLSGLQVSSALFLESSTNRLWLGGADGSLWTGGVLTGNAGSDALQLQKVASTVNPVGGAVVKPVLYVGYGEVAGVPYAYALDASLLTVYTIGTNGWTPLWAASTSAGYPYKSGSFSAAVASMATLTSGSVVSDQPLIVGGSLLVPVYVPGSQCAAGHGYYDFFELATGLFPQLDTGSNTTPSLPLTYSDGRPITAPIDLGAGSGPAFAPSMTLTSDGGALNQGAAGGTDCSNAAGCAGGNGNPLLPPDVLLVKAKSLSGPVGWRQR